MIRYRRVVEGLKRCYKSPKREIVFCMFEHLIHNLKTYNRVKI